MQVYFSTKISPPEIKKKKSSVGAPRKPFEDKKRTGQFLVSKEIVDEALKRGATSNPVPPMMAATLLALRTGENASPDTAFVIHQMNAHPELAPRLKNYLVNPSKRMY